ncbi:MAG: DUF3572 domain-containing protein [Parerythrobacter sp.]
MTIHTASQGQVTRPEAETLALSALGWLLGDEKRADRLLDLTGLTADTLRNNLTDPAVLPEVLGAVLEFLARHEPDLIGAAGALQVDPATLIAAQEVLAR